MTFRLWIVSTSLLLCACKGVPTSVLLEIQAASGVALDEIRLRIFEPGGEAVSDRRLPAEGKATVPASVVLYPRSSEGALRLLARARLAGVETGEDASTVTPVSGAQVRATLLLRPGALPDADRDGVPDLIDSCPTIANPAQGPCGGLDGGRDRTRLDAPTDAGADQAPSDVPRLELPKLTDFKKPDLPKPSDLKKPDLPKPPDLLKPDLPKPDLPKPPDGACPPLGGSYTLGPAMASSFPSFAAAIGKLVKCGVNAPTTITVAGGSYQEPGFSFPPIPGSSASARVTFRAASGSTVKLAGVTGTSSSAGIIRIAANTAHLVLEGFDLDGSLAANLIPASYSGPVVFDQAAGQQDITLRRLEIHDFGPTAWSSTNYIGGIYIQQSAIVTDLTIEGCAFRNLNPASSFHTQGAISTRNGQFKGLRVVGNRFSGIQKMDCLNLRNGIFEGLLVANNFFVLDTGAAGTGALELYGSNTLIGSENRIVFNTIVAPTGTPYGFSGLVVAPGSLQLQNNILQGTTSATSFSTISGATLQGGYNCIYLASPGSGYTLATSDLTVNPQLLSPLDLHLAAGSPLLGKGTSIPGVTTDIDGQTRGSPPEIGADEVP